MTVSLTPRRLRIASRLRAMVDSHPAVIGIAVFTVLAAVSRPASFRTPIERDTGQYLYVGQKILDGGVPYADAANNKGPVAFLLFAAFRLVDHHSVIALRLLLVLFAGLAALAVAAYVTRLAGREVGFLAGAVFAVLGSATALQGDDPNTEQFGVALMAGAWWLATLDGRRAAVAAGALASAATLMNVGFVAIVPIVVFELLRSRPSGRGARIGAAAAGGLAAAVPVLTWLGLSGALPDMWDQVVRQAADAVGHHVPAHLGEARVSDPLSPRSLLDVPAGALWIGGVAGAALALADQRLRAAAVGALVWIVLMWARVKVAGYSFPHHYYLGMPGIAAGLALGIASIWDAVPGRRAATAAFVLAVPIWAYVAGPQWRALDMPPSDRWGVNSSFALAYPTAKFIREHTDPGDPILVSGAEPQVYWLARRHAPTRFFDVYPIYWRPDYQQERQRDISSHPPRAIAAIGGETDPDIAALIAQGNYRVAFERSGARVWLRAGQ